MSSPDIATTAFLFLAIAIAGGSLAFLAAQRASGKTSREVERVLESALLLESVAKDLRALRADVSPKDEAKHAEGDLEGAQRQLDDAIAGLRRGVDLAM